MIKEKGWYDILKKGFAFIIYNKAINWLIKTNQRNINLVCLLDLTDINTSHSYVYDISQYITFQKCL